MDIIVQKFGGTSVKDKECLDNICNKALKVLEEKNTKLIIIVSAQGKTTDNLIKLKNEYSNINDSKSLDLLLCTGEITTTALLCMMLNEKNINSTFLTGWQAGIITDSNFGEAKIQTICSNNILQKLEEYDVIVIPGFQGTDKFGNITTLGRGGSDLTAVAIASALKAKKCEIYTDVDGVLSADPKIIKNAKLVSNISYDEMLEAASSGAKVLHNRCVNYAKNNDIKLYVKNSQKETIGTCVCKYSSNLCENSEVKIISKLDNLTKISIISDMISNVPKIFETIYNTADELNTQIYMISHGEISINILVDTNKADLLIAKLHEKLIK